MHYRLHSSRSYRGTQALPPRQGVSYGGVNWEDYRNLMIHCRDNAWQPVGTTTLPAAPNLDTCRYDDEQNCALMAHRRITDKQQIVCDNPLVKTTSQQLPYPITRIGDRSHFIKPSLSRQIVSYSYNTHKNCCFHNESRLALHTKTIVLSISLILC